MKIPPPIYVRPWIVQSRDPYNPKWATVEHHPHSTRRLSFFLEYDEAAQARDKLVAYYDGIGRSDVEFRVVRK